MKKKFKLNIKKTLKRVLGVAIIYTIPVLVLSLMMDAPTIKNKIIDSAIIVAVTFGILVAFVLIGVTVKWCFSD